MLALYCLHQSFFRPLVPMRLPARPYCWCKGFFAFVPRSLFPAVTCANMAYLLAFPLVREHFFPLYHALSFPPVTCVNVAYLLAFLLVQNFFLCTTLLPSRLLPWQTWLASSLSRWCESIFFLCTTLPSSSWLFPGANVAYLLGRTVGASIIC